MADFFGGGALKMSSAAHRGKNAYQRLQRIKKTIGTPNPERRNYPPWCLYTAFSECAAVCRPQTHGHLHADYSLPLLCFVNFFLEKQQKTPTPSPFIKPVRCMLFNYFNIYSLNSCLRVPPAHATPMFAVLKVSIYIAKGEYLYR